MKDIFLERMLLLLGTESVLQKEPMNKHTTFRIGGPADYFIKPKTIEEMKQVLSLLKEYQKPYMVIGNGSNLLVSDHGYRGVMIQYSAKNPLQFEEISEKETNELNASYVNKAIVTADASMLLSKLSMEVAEAGYTGFEFAAGIPGSIGGVVTMNAGAYGSEIKDYIVSALVMEQNGTIHNLSKEELKLSYRHSVIQDMNLIVLQAKFILTQGNKLEIFKKIEELNKKRREKQPLEFPSAGSAFKRPEGSYAGKLIMDAGLSGYFVGGAMVSTKHCGFVVNTKNAKASDVYLLLKDISQMVNEKFHVVLEPEIKIVGDFTKS